MFLHLFLFELKLANAVSCKYFLAQTWFPKKLNFYNKNNFKCLNNYLIKHNWCSYDMSKIKAV